MEPSPSVQSPPQAARDRFRARPATDPALSLRDEGGRRAPAAGLPPEARAFLDKLLTLQVLDGAAAEVFLAPRSDRLAEYASAERLGQALVHAGLLTDYQLGRVLGGTTHGLVLGNYRILEVLGSGGMGRVFVAEHGLMKRRVAVKVLPVDDDCLPAVRQRFYSEMRVLAELFHPNVVLAFDAGEVRPADPALPELMYLVMELVEGGDLEKQVLRHGPFAVARACDCIRQAACGLQAAHDRHLVHRDLKPSNLLLTASGRVKLVDFGLVRQFCSRLTDPRALLGSIEFMAPEQSQDPSAVGKEADIYALGTTLFWLLTGEAPYPFASSVGAALRALQRDRPRRLRDLRPEAPAALEALIDGMLERNPAHRPPSPLAVMNALAPFAAGQTGDPRDRAALLTEQLRESNLQLQQSLDARGADVRQAHDALLFAMAKMAESRDGETPGHLRRLQCYARSLARAAAAEPPWADLVDDRFLAELERCMPLHDIGKLGLPDNVLLKPAALSPAERLLVEQHPVIGDRILEALGREHGSSLEFLGMARAIVRHHHEHFDGEGYPDGLAGDAIPAAARLAAVADVYDALRRKRLHKPAMSHEDAIGILFSSEGQFDPSLLAALVCCEKEWERIYADIA
jgi:serine/threonine protein kinase